jgi:hypothetical protein
MVVEFAYQLTATTLEKVPVCEHTFFFIEKEVSSDMHGGFGSYV